MKSSLLLLTVSFAVYRVAVDPHRLLLVAGKKEKPGTAMMVTRETGKEKGKEIPWSGRTARTTTKTRRRKMTLTTTWMPTETESALPADPGTSIAEIRVKRICNAVTFDCSDKFIGG